MKKTITAIGLRAKTARAIAVLISGTVDAPVALSRHELIFATPKTPATFQPYHEVMDEPWERAQALAKKSESMLVANAAKALRQLIDQADSASVVLVGVVGAPDRQLQKIGSPHIRAHAAEGVLFRRILELAAKEIGVECRTYAEKELQKHATAKLGVSEYAISQKLEEFGKAVGRPWRADEKAAAIGAWLAVAEHK